jgi:cbb3-type cytochrome oxidase subunit 1
LIATVGSVVGYFVDSQKGVPSALIGASLALVFTSLTLVSVLIGRRLSLAGFFGAVMGGWLVKLIGYIGGGIFLSGMLVMAWNIWKTWQITREEIASGRLTQQEALA